MTDPTLFKLLGVSVFLTFLLLLAYYIARKGKSGGIYSDKKKTQRIQILETQALDPKRHIHLINVDQMQYIVLTSATSETIITHINRDREPQPTFSPSPDFGITNFGNVIPGDQR
jgi:flagellar biogenesis protein FliO